MKTTDLFTSNRAANRLNESFERMFGKRIELENFDLHQLQDVRNKLRTQISQVRSQSGFNETIENEALTKAQWMLDAINAEMTQREDIYQPVEEASDVDAELAKLIQGDDYFDDIYDAMGREDEVGQKLQDIYNDVVADTGLHPDDDLERIIDIIAGRLEDEYGESDYDDEPQGSYDSSDDADALASAGFGSDEDYGDYGYDESIEEKAPPGAKAERMVKHIKKGYAKDGKLTDKERGIAYATAWKHHNKSKSESTQTGEDMRKVTEGEIQQAQSIVTAKTMVDRVGRWIEELSGMENDTLLQLGDQIRDEMGSEQAKNFISGVAPAIQQALENLKTTRETLATGVRTLTGEEQAAGMLGAEPGAEGGMGGDEMAPSAPDEMNAEPAIGGDDEFAAAEPAAGGLEDTGREQRESIQYQNRLLKVLAG